MERLYGRGYELMKQLGYNGKGCGKHEQGICVPIEPNTQDMKTSLGYSFSKITKTTQQPSLNINTITCKPRITLTLKHPKFLDMTSPPSWEYVESDEALKQMLGATNKSSFSK